MRLGWIAAAGDLLLGACCPGCEQPRWGLCRSCRQALSERTARFTTPDPCPPGFPPTVTSGAYDPAIRRMIIAHKERQAYGLAPTLGELLAVACWRLLRSGGPSTPTEPVLLVPVPSSPAAVRERGYDATWALARRATARLRTGAAVGAARLLRQARTVDDQAGLDAGQRRRNLSHGLVVRTSIAAPRPGLAGSLIIVDDVVTTGASLTEASRALTEAGHRVLGAATIAATRRRR